MALVGYSKEWGRVKPPAGTPIRWGGGRSRQLVGFWPFNENAGWRIIDATRRLPIMTAAGSPTWAGGNLVFDGVAIAITSAGTAAHLDFTSSFTLVTRFTWATQARTDTAFIAKISPLATAFQGYMLFASMTDGPRAYINGAFRTSSAGALTAGQRYEAACTWDGATVSVYLDGKLIATGAYATAPTSAGEIFRIGEYSYPSTQFTGRMEYVAAWSRCLSAREIADQYVAPYEMFQPPAVWSRLFVGASGAFNIAVGQANETDSAFARALSEMLVAGRANETDAAFVRALSELLATGRANEIDSAFTRALGELLAAGRANETDAAFARALGEILVAGRANETDSAFALALLTAAMIAAGRADEIDLAMALALLVGHDWFTAAPGADWFDAATNDWFE